MEAEMVCDVRGDSNYFPALPDTCAQMTIPLITHDSVVGVLNLETSEVNCFSDESFEFVKLLAGRIAGSVENAQLYTLSLKQVVELKGTYDQVRELEQIKTQMFRIATHDLKDPLNVITGYLSLMEMDEAQLSTDHVTFLEEMRKQSNRMLQIIDDILTMERMKEALVHEPINMQEIVNDAINDMVSQAIQKTQVVETKLPDGLTMVNGDRVQIREAVTNLIGNAIKYTPDGGHITIKLENAAERIVFEVKDDGYGIPEDRQRRLFQPFYRAKAEGTENIPGTGLGLHLVKDIIERHGGGVRFNSVFGKGSTFGFDLPSGA
jgi:hypothetical protein